MKKILDFLIIFLLVFLIISLFNNKKQEKDASKLIFTTDSSYTIPANIVLKIENHTSESVKIDTCNDLKINFSGENLEFPEDFCKHLEIETSKKTELDYSSQYKKFEKTGNYVFDINIGGKKYIQSFKIEHKGSISKLFVGIFYAPVYNLMIFLVDLFSYSMGLAIIFMTIIIRIILIYPQHKMMLSQRKLQSVQPKIKEVQDKYKGNSQMLGMKLMELYKKEKVNPMGSCGFLLIQMPILIVIYHVILYVKDPSNYYYIYDFLSGVDLTSISYNFFGLDLLGAGGVSGLILGVSVGLVQYLQIRLSLKKINTKDDKNKVVLEKKKGENSYSQFMPDPELMNKFMLYGLPVMVGIFTYTLIAGVGIYRGTSTLFMILQQLFVNKVSKKQM